MTEWACQDVGTIHSHKSTHPPRRALLFVLMKQLGN
jgi:hypothetical protein